MRTGESGCATAACVAACVWVGTSVGATGQEAYFSIEGQVIAAGGTHQLFFDLDRPVDSSENLLFQNFTDSGGVNAAGDSITASGFDSVLDLFNAGGGGIAAQNDDGGAGRDSLLSWAGVAPGGGGVLSPDPLPALADYRLTISDFGSNNTGPWAVDLVGPADALTLSNLVGATATPGGVSQVDSVKFGTRLGGAAGPLGPTAATWNHTDGSLIEIMDQLVVANTGHATLSISDGQVSVENLTTIRAGGQIDLIGSEMFTDVQLNALGGINLELDAASASTPRDSTLNVLSRAATVSAGAINVGTSTTGTGTATINIDGGTYLSTQVNQTDGATLTVGNNSGAGLAVISAINYGVFNTGTGLTTVNATGSFRGGRGVAVRGDLLIDGGEVIGIDSVAGQLTIRNGGVFDYGINYSRITPNGMLIESGGNANFIDLFADAAGATYVIDGEDSFAFVSYANLGRDTAFTVRNSARFVVDLFELSGFDLGSPTDDVVFRLESGATAFADTVRIANQSYSGKASLTVTGADTVFDDRGGPDIGSDTGGAASLTVADGGVYNVIGPFNRSNVNTTGSLNVAGGTFNTIGEVDVDGGVVNLASGKLTADAIDITNNGTFNFTGGTLEAATFGGSLSQLGGTFDVRTESAASVVNGNYDIQNAALAVFATLGAGPALTVNGLTTLGPGATLQVDLDPDGMDLSDGDSIVLIQSTGGVIGTFESEIITAPSGLLYEITYNSNDVLLSAITAMLAGDYNGNGTVDAADYTVWADNFGSMVNLAADGNGNGTVDAADYTIWQDNFGNTLNPPASTTLIPEPTSLALLVIGAGLIGRRRRAAA